MSEASTASPSNDFTERAFRRPRVSGAHIKSFTEYEEIYNRAETPEAFWGERGGKIYVVCKMGRRF